MAGWNVFRILGDCSHALSKCILIFAIHRNKSAEGVSLITQVLYAVVFCTRYLDLFQTSSRWNLIFKIFYILSSLYIIVIMRWVYPRTREREIAWKMGAVVFAGSLLLSPFVMLIFDRGDYSAFNWIYDFSLILESVCVLPQLLLLRQTTVPTVIDSFYLLALGSYRALYIFNWIDRGFDTNDIQPRAVSVIFGVIQTALYLDFAWVYWTRQRVKLRGGGVVDADDIHRGWLLNRIFGRHAAVDADGEDEESGPALAGGRRGGGGGRAKWGSRGISIRADDGVFDAQAGRPLDDEDDEDDEEHGIVDATGGPVDPDAKMQDPDELAKALDDEDEDGTLPGASSSAGKVRAADGSGVTGGDEWDD